MSAYASDVTEATFQKDVIERSREVPVLVDFWAPWCGPCRTLKPVLEKLAVQYEGKFQLAKVNSDENQQLAVQFGVRSIPNVKAFVDGQLVDEFLGAQPESAVREFIDGLMPRPEDLLRRDARARAEAGDLEGALALLEQAEASGRHDDHVLADRIQLLLTLGRVDDAKATAARLGPLASQEPAISALLAQLQFAGTGTGDDSALRARIEADPQDLGARLDLAKREIAAQRHEAGLEQLLEIIRRDRKWNAEAGRKTMLAVFDLLGSGSELVSKYRRLLASALN